MVLLLPLHCGDADSMLVHIPGVLNAGEVVAIRRILQHTEWVDGVETAGEQAAAAKSNLQLREGSPEAIEAGKTILRALGANALFNSAALPLRVLPPLFNRYDAGMKFNDHVDGAVRLIPNVGIRIRADVSSTLFLTAPEDYDGGELVVSDTYGQHSVKLPAGDMVVYPATSLHRVNGITRGSRWSSFFWTQSMVKDDGQRTMLFELDRAIIGIRRSLLDDNPHVVSLTSHYHNLLRRWAEL